MKKIQLSIPRPCHENWDAMKPSEKGKFCASCQKTVIDFTEMSDRQIAEFFKRPIGSVCGHFYQSQLNKDIELPKKRIPWVKYFFQFTLPAFLVSMKSNAQKTRVVGDTTYCTPTKGLVATMVPQKSISSKTISGQIVDADGNKIAFATIIIKNSQIGTQSDGDGKFELMAPPNSTLVFSAVGYNSKELEVKDQLSNLLVTFEKSDVALSGDIAIVGYTIRKKSKPIPAIKKVIDTAFKKFSVYPNPAKGNTYIQIDFKRLKAANYKISIINLSGEIIQTDERDVEDKNKTATLLLKDVAAGTYFIRLFNKKTAATYSEKIIVQ